MKRRAGIGTLCVLISKIYEPVTFHFHRRFEKNIPISLIELVVESYNKTPLRNFESTSSNPDDSSLFAGYFVSVSTCFFRVYPRIEGNFFSTTASRFHFSLFQSSLYLSSFCVLPIPKWFSTCLFPFYPTYECVSFEMYTLHPFPLSSSFRYSFSISHISSFHFPFARSFLLYIYTGYRGANRIPVWQTRLIFWKGRIFAKNRQNAVAIVDQIVLRRCTSFLWNTWLINTAVRMYAICI